MNADDTNKMPIRVNRCSRTTRFYPIHRQMAVSLPGSVTWVLEAEVFPESHRLMCDAVVAEGHELILWSDDWLARRAMPRLEDRSVIFHGSLGNADAVARHSLWRPGAFCNTKAFACSAWYPAAREWLLHQNWTMTTVAELVANPAIALGTLGDPGSVFVRPDSPLKPFSGRVLRRDAISLEALDFGFYYDDPSLPIVVTPVRQIFREWRYVVVSKGIVAGSAYAADRRAANSSGHLEAPLAYAAEVARKLNPPEDVFVLDVCESNDGLHLLELNPFSGADLYACSHSHVVHAVSRYALELTDD